MSLNIKSAEADKLVTEVARITGESKTQAVIESLRQRLERELSRRAREGLADDILAIGVECAAYPLSSEGSHADLLYDEVGLPKRLSIRRL